MAKSDVQAAVGVGCGVWGQQLKASFSYWAYMVRDLGPPVEAGNNTHVTSINMLVTLGGRGTVKRWQAQLACSFFCLSVVGFSACWHNY